MAIGRGVGPPPVAPSATARSVDKLGAMEREGETGHMPAAETSPEARQTGAPDATRADPAGLPPAAVGPHPVALWLRVTIFMVLFIGVQMTVGTLVGIVAVVVLLADGRGLDGVTDVLTSDAMLLQGTMVSSLPMMAALLGLCILVRRHLDGRSPWSMGLARPRQGWSFTVAVGLLAGGVPLAAAVGVLALAGDFSGWSVDFSLLTWLLLPTLLVAAFSEEITCRGYLLQTFADEGRLRTGLVVSSVFFWVMHSLNPAVWSTPLASLNLFGAGVVLALAYLASGNVWFPTLVHFAWNAVQGVLFELPMSGVVADGVIDLERTGTLPGWLGGGDFGLEGSVLITAGEILLAVGFLLWWRRGRREPAHHAEVAVLG